MRGDGFAGLFAAGLIAALAYIFVLGVVLATLIR